MSGFSGSNAALVVGEEEDVDLLLTDSRYTQRAKDESPDIQIEINGEFIKLIHKRLQDKSVKQIAVDPLLMNISQGEAVADE